MTTIQVENSHSSSLNEPLNSSAIHTVIEPVLPQFDAIMSSYIAFHALFLTVGFLELVLFLIFFTFLAKSSILAFSLALVFLTFFSYFILKVYFQTKKLEQFKDLRDRYVGACKSLCNYQEEVPEHHIAVSNACCKLANAFQGREYRFYSIAAKWLSPLSSYREQFSYRCHWQDVHKMREFLLLSAIEENIKLVKCDPTSLEVHAALANSYVMLSALYMEPNKHTTLEDSSWMSLDESVKALLENKFRATAERAIEEFKILKDFAPDDPWVHAQLAYSYHDLKMPKEEILEYEALLKLCPDDYDTLFKLGILYFEQGMNARGLSVYDQLKNSHYKKAEEMIKSYGAYHISF